MIKANYEFMDHSHCWRSENPPCGIKGYHRCCLCELPVPHNFEAVDKQFRSTFLRTADGGYHLLVPNMMGIQPTMDDFMREFKTFLHEKITEALIAQNQKHQLEVFEAERHAREDSLAKLIEGCQSDLNIDIKPGYSIASKVIGQPKGIQILKEKGKTPEEAVNKLLEALKNQSL